MSYDASSLAHNRQSFVRFDASDQMPSAVGSGSFWSEMVKLVNGAQDIDTTLNNIEASWPK